MERKLKVSPTKTAFSEPSDYAGKPIFATIRTRVVQTIVEPITADDRGSSIGALVDAHMQRWQEEASHARLAGDQPPVIQSITIDFPMEDY